MKRAKKSDWKTVEMPAKQTTLRLNRLFMAKEMTLIRKGHIPQEMEDKWFVFWSKNTLFFHRSWTGFCIFVVQFVKEDSGFRMVEAVANRDDDQYEEDSDEQDVKLITYLVDALLLDRDAVFPSDKPSSDESVLQNWSLMGRLMLGKHPNDENEPLV